MNQCCTQDKEFIINQGAQCNVVIIGKLLEEGRLYTGVLYHDARNEQNRAVVLNKTATAFGDSVKLVLDFPGSETIKLKAGNTVTLEFYDEDKVKFGYRERFAKVRPTSIQQNKYE